MSIALSTLRDRLSIMIGEDYPAGTTAAASSIGRHGGALFVFLPCEICGKLRWTKLFGGQVRYTRCHICYGKSCSGVNNHFWAGGRRKVDGYIMVALPQNDFFYSMTQNDHRRNYRYVFEHRLIMAKHLGRCLQSFELVHHKNGIRDDNRIENLQLVTGERHQQITILENKIKFLERRVLVLETDNILFKSQMNEVKNGNIVYSKG